jgi:pseudouridine kinase
MREGYITVIGAANIDLTGQAYSPLVSGDSNPGRISVCPGGVGRNIAENLARLSVDVRFIGALGDDLHGQTIREVSERAGVDMGHCHTGGGNTSTYMAILDGEGEMALALADMDILEKIPPEHFIAKRALIDGAELIVLDANLPEGVILYILDNFPHKQIFIDPVSVSKAARLKGIIGRFDTFKMNRLEAECLSGMSLFGDDALQRAGDYFMGKGVKRIFITLGAGGAFYQSATGNGFCPGPHRVPVNVTGAGDAFMAGIAYCTLKGRDDAYTARFACAMSRLTLASAYSVSPCISITNVEAEYERP